MEDNTDSSTPPRIMPIPNTASITLALYPPRPKCSSVISGNSMASGIKTTLKPAMAIVMNTIGFTETKVRQPRMNSCRKDGACTASGFG
ncbi:hypothetical protein D3C80_1428520 [compost metagenome]